MITMDDLEPKILNAMREQLRTTEFRSARLDKLSGKVIAEVDFNNGGITSKKVHVIRVIV